MVRTELVHSCHYPSLGFVGRTKKQVIYERILRTVGAEHLIDCCDKEDST
jgi:hypothetical protein